MLKPCLVLGTGFHKWVLGEAGDRIELTSWNGLLKAVANQMQVSWSEGIDDPALSWATLLTTATSEGFFDQKILVNE